MRLDKYLKVSRLIKRRTVANEACDNERISANGRVVKASYDVKEGDKLEIRFGACPFHRICSAQRCVRLLMTKRILYLN